MFLVFRLRGQSLWLAGLWTAVVGLGVLFSYQMRTAVTMADIANHRVVLDPGHGGKDPGAVGHGAREDRIVLAVTRDLRSDLVRRGIEVIVTRNGHQDLLNGNGTKRLELSKRVEIANTAGADVFLSIHANSGSSPRWHGAQVFVDRDASPLSLRLGERIQEALRREVGTARKLNQGINHYLLKKVRIPAATVELGFISNPREARLLQEPAYQRRLARAIYRGVLAYLSSLPASRPAG